jgi:hypothetical protein
MATSGRQDKKKTTTITEIGITKDVLTSRGGLILFVRYLQGIGIYEELGRRFGRMRKSAKGIEIIELFKQLFCFFIDGTSRHLCWFDNLKRDEGYARGIETDPEGLASSHAIKRFFKSFSWVKIWLFRKVLRQLFLWRLLIVRPEVILIDVDSMVMANDEACKRHGVQPTYKGKKGFHPIQATWSRFIVDAVFQGGKNHCNHGDTVEKMIKHLVADIRLHYRGDVPIIFSFDSGYFDQKLLQTCEMLRVGYVCGGKLYQGVKEYLGGVEGSCFKEYDKVEQTWNYFEFGDKPASWSKYRRAIFCRPTYENRQMLFEFARPDTLMYTNLGMGQAIDAQLKKAGREDFLTAESCISVYHGRGRNELVNRAFKDFGFEELPFKRFSPNAALYYTMLLSFFLFESFKADVLTEVTPMESYATTVRRKAIDIAAKIVRTGGKVILRVTSAVWESLNMPVLWERSGNPPEIIWAEGF